MKKKLFIILGMTVGLAGLATGIHSCAIDEESGRAKPGVDATVIKARTFFENEVGAPSLPDTYHKAGGNSPATRSAEIGSLLAGAIEPDWEKARAWEDDYVSGVTVPAILTRSVNYLTLVENRGDTVSITNQSPHVRILFNENKETGESVCFMATLLPDEFYEGDLFLLDSNPEGSDYWGLAIYSHPDGTPEYGYRYEDGLIVNTLRFDLEYNDQIDPNIRILMGFVSGLMTRGTNPQYEIIIDPVICTPPVTPKDPLPKNEADDMNKWKFNDDFGSGGGGGGNAPTTSDNDDDDDEEEKGDDKAKELFESDDLTEEQWKELERMLEEIMIDCMGGKLYNALTAIGQFPIEFGFSRKNSVFRTDGSFALKDYNSDVLFHEMFHALQFHQETSLTSFNGSIVNQEIEAYIAQYRFLQNIAPFSWEAMLQLQRYYNNSFFISIRNLSDSYISPKGILYPGTSEDFKKRYLTAARQIKDNYDTDVQIDLDRSFEQNFKNLANLTINCL